MTSIICLGLAVALTTIFTAIICRRQLAWKQQPSSKAMLVGAFSAAAVVTIFSLLYFAGANVYSAGFWTNPALPGVRGYVLQWALTGLVCVFPAAFVVAKFQLKMR